MRIIRDVRGHTFGVALGRHEGTQEPAHANATRVIRGRGMADEPMVAVWFRWGRIWHVRARAE